VSALLAAREANAVDHPFDARYRTIP
jgi:hypothetical protein